jgi:Limonene-1,2-epoxide hydrolase catalytic domain
MDIAAISSNKQRYTVDDELRYAAIVRDFITGNHDELTADNSPFAENARIFYDSNPGEAVFFPNNECFMGLAKLKEMSEAYSKKGFTYEVEIHSVYAAGPLVVVTRTDIRKEAGKPDIAFPAVGVFAFKDGKIIEWSDYFR